MLEQGWCANAQIIRTKLVEGGSKTDCSYINICTCMSVCTCVCVHERERGRERE
jgi:hypothetical protein